MYGMSDVNTPYSLFRDFRYPQNPISRPSDMSSSNLMNYTMSSKTPSNQTSPITSPSGTSAKIRSPSVLPGIMSPPLLSIEQGKQRIPSIPSSGMPLPIAQTFAHRSLSSSPSHNPLTRNDYPSAVSHLIRPLPLNSSTDTYPLTTAPKQEPLPSPTFSPSLIPLEPDHKGDPMTIDMTSDSMRQSEVNPGLEDTVCLHQIISAEGHLIRPDIQARIDKGFFLSDTKWTCYRRNYFSVVCSYSLSPATFTSPLFLRRNNGQTEPISAFAVKIAAVVDGPHGKAVDLVQHTPKRDKGPQNPPPMVKLVPNPAGLSSALLQQSARMSINSDYEYGYSQPPSNQPQNNHTYDRIQFKSATANNGKRRAAQQFYHLLVELYVDIGPSNLNDGYSLEHDGNWVKVAYRLSVPMVVRGRSPGHYTDERGKGRTASLGPDSVSGHAVHQHHHPSIGYSGTSLPTIDSHFYQHKQSLSSNSSDHHELPSTSYYTDADHNALNSSNSYQYYPLMNSSAAQMDFFPHHAQNMDRKHHPYSMDVPNNSYGSTNLSAGYPSLHSSRRAVPKQEEAYTSNWEAASSSRYDPYHKLDKPEPYGRYSSAAETSTGLYAGTIPPLC